MGTQESFLQNRVNQNILSCKNEGKGFQLNKIEWQAFLRCIITDNDEDLREAAKHLDWTAFLQSSDVSGMCSDCSPQFVHTFAIGDATHPFPTNPFFVAIFYNAQKCLTFMHQSGVDFSKITEHGFTAYHILFDAIRFMSRDHHEHVHMHGAATDSQVSAECSKLVSLFHDTLFTSEQQQHMLQSVCRFGMTPMSWGVFLGLANHVEYVMRYYAADTMVQSDVVGLNERVSIDVSEFVGENPSFFTSPICILLDLYGQSDLAQIKALGIFRSGFIWRQWVEALYMRNINIVRLILANWFLLTFATAFFSVSNVDNYLKSCCTVGTKDLPYGLIGVLLHWLLTDSVSILLAALSLWRKERHRKRVGYPAQPRRNHCELLIWCLPLLVSLPLSLFLLWLFLDTGRSCAMFGEQIYSVSGCGTIMLLILGVSLVISFMRNIQIISTMMSSLYRSIVEFALFAALYILITAVCARMFQSSFAFSMSLSSNSSVTAPDDVAQFLKAYYQTFLVSLNVVDTKVFVPSADRIDLIIAHVFYVLFVPILFINFAIGILSSTVSYVQEHTVESRYITMLTVAEFTETCLFFLKKCRKIFFCSGKMSVSICEPVKNKRGRVAKVPKETG